MNVTVNIALAKDETLADPLDVTATKIIEALQGDTSDYCLVSVTVPPGEAGSPPAPAEPPA